jgi:hypothetical protein
LLHQSGVAANAVPHAGTDAIHRAPGGRGRRYHAYRAIAATAVSFVGTVANRRASCGHGC